jgi:hypothetical protein
MPSTKRKLQLLAAFTALLSLAVAVGCKGFFVNPTLTELTISPQTPSVEQGKTLQMTATGTFDDGSTRALTGDVGWSTDDLTIATITSSGRLTGVGLGQTSVTAVSGAINTSTTVSVQLANVVSIAVTPTNPSILVGGHQQFTAMATVQGGGMVDITTSAKWLSSNTTIATIDTTGLATGLAAGTTNITATSGSVVSNIVPLVVN